MQNDQKLPYLLQFYKNNQSWIDRCLEIYELSNSEKIKLVNELITKSFAQHQKNKENVAAQFDIVLKDFVSKHQLRTQEL